MSAKGRGVACAAAVAVLAACGGSSSGSGPSANPRDGYVWSPAQWGVTQAAINRDGSMAAIVNRRQSPDQMVALIDSDGVHPITGTTPMPADLTWLPDGDLLISQMADPAGPTPLAIVSRAGAIQKVLHPHPAISASTGMSPLSDGSAVIVSASRPGLGRQTDLYEISLHTGAARQLTRTPTINERDPHVAARGQVAYVAERQGSRWVQILDLRSLRTHRLTQPSHKAGSLVTSPDGQYALYSLVATAAQEADNGLWAIPITGGRPKRLYSGTVAGHLQVTPDERGTWGTVGTVGPNFAIGGLLFRSIPPLG